MGLFGGLLGWDAADERLPDSTRAIQDAGIAVRIEIVDVGDPHPNTYRLTLNNDHETHTLKAISTGGGYLYDLVNPGAPFIAVAIANGVVFLAAAVLRLKERKTT